MKKSKTIPVIKKGNEKRKPVQNIREKGGDKSVCMKHIINFIQRVILSYSFYLGAYICPGTYVYLVILEGFSWL